MVMYFLSATLAFIVFAIIGNVIVNIKYEDGFDHFDEVQRVIYWVVLLAASFGWMVAIPATGVGFVIFLLNKFTTRISRGIINSINKRKHK